MSLLTRLERHIHNVCLDWNAVGAAVAIVRGGEALYVQGFGLRQAGLSAQVGPDTLFQIGSASKAFAAAAVAVLVEEGKVRWDDPIIDHVPEFCLEDPWLTRNATLRDALAHRTGLSHSVFPFLAVMDSQAALGELRHLHPKGPFRDSCLYSNLMYAATAPVVERRSGDSWQAFIKQRLLRRLDMHRSGTSPYEFWDPQYVAPTYLGAPAATRWSIEEARDGDLAMPHALERDGSHITLPWQSYDNAAPAGSMISSAGDMAKWMRFHLCAGKGSSSPACSRTMETLHAAQNWAAGAAPFPFEGAMSYALGWWRVHYRGRLALVHSGGMLGFPAYVALLPEQQIGVTVLANTALPLGMAFHKSLMCEVFDQLLGEVSRDWSREFLHLAADAQRQAQDDERGGRASRLPNSPPSLSLNRYAGVYADPAAPSHRVTVQAQNEDLALIFAGEGAFTARLEPWHHEVFRLQLNSTQEDVLGPTFVRFIIDPAGNVESLSAFGESLQRLRGPS